MRSRVRRIHTVHTAYALPTDRNSVRFVLLLALLAYLFVPACSPPTSSEGTDAWTSDSTNSNIVTDFKLVLGPTSDLGALAHSEMTFRGPYDDAGRQYVTIRTTATHAQYISERHGFTPEFHQPITTSEGRDTPLQGRQEQNALWECQVFCVREESTSV